MKHLFLVLTLLFSFSLTSSDLFAPPTQTCDQEYANQGTTYEAAAAAQGLTTDTTVDCKAGWYSFCSACCKQNYPPLNPPIQGIPIVCVDKSCLSECYDYFNHGCVEWSWLNNNPRQYCLDCCGEVDEENPDPAIVRCRQNCEYSVPAVIWPDPDTELPSPPTAPPSSNACRHFQKKQPDAQTGDCPAGYSKQKEGTNCPSNLGTPQWPTNVCIKCPASCPNPGTKSRDFKYGDNKKCQIFEPVCTQ